MRVLIFGANGMLGHKLYQRMSSQFDVLATIRRDFKSVERFGIFSRSSIVENIDVSNAVAIRSAIEYARPNCVINAVGLIKQLPKSKDVIQALAVNSIFPNRLAELSSEFGFRLITISTDCVFDGKRGNYAETDAPDASDLYGLSKLLGEVTIGEALTIRTSIIGRELSTSNSIVEWFLGKRGASVKGFQNAIYTGFPSIVLADIIADLIAHHPEVNGLYHVSGEKISKFDLLLLLNKYFDANVTIEPSAEVVVDRSLDSSKFRVATGFQPAKWAEMIEQMATDSTPYEKLRNQ
jgi:dTDP-4-dehydrorhamnose reductase